MNTNDSAADDPLGAACNRELLEGFAGLHQLVLVSNRKGRIVWISESLGWLCGRADRFIGRKVTELIPRLPHTDQLTSIRSDLRNSTNVAPTRLELTPREDRATAVDVSTFQIGSAEKEGPLFVVLVRPVDEPQASFDPSRADALAEMLAAFPDAAIAYDRARFITGANSAAGALLGRSSSEMIGKPLSLILARGAEAEPSLRARGGTPDLPVERELEIERADGSRAWLSVCERPLPDADGESGGVVSLRDVSDRKRHQDWIERKNAELESYVHSVSHDLRSPLASLLGFTRLLRQDYEGLLDDTGRHFLDRIEQAGRRMETLIHDLLELSRIDEPEEQKRLVDPRAVLLQLKAELKPRLDEQCISLLLPEDAPMLMCDQTRLYQVFSNLVGNAVQHMGPNPNPTIAVDVREEGDSFHIPVADNGCGIPLDQQERIFEVFRTAGPRSADRPSSGIGLAIVKKIAEAHDGRVWVESNPGEGATFHLLLRQ